MTFLIGCVLGATIVLMVTGETGAAPPRAPIAASAFEPSVESAGELLIPVRGVLPRDLKSQFFEKRSGGRTHAAIDIRAPRGTAVLAAADGTIRKLFTSRAGGLTIYQYDVTGSTCYYYAHLDSYASIREGQRVSKGDVIGYVGTTGNAPPDTPHLHFAVNRLTASKEWWRGTPVDPYPYLVAQPATGRTSRASVLR